MLYCETVSFACWVWWLELTFFIFFLESVINLIGCTWFNNSTTTSLSVIFYIILVCFCFLIFTLFVLTSMNIHNYILFNFSFYPYMRRVSAYYILMDAFCVVHELMNCQKHFENCAMFWTNILALSIKKSAFTTGHSKPKSGTNMRLIYLYDERYTTLVNYLKFSKIECLRNYPNMRLNECKMLWLDKARTKKKINGRNKPKLRLLFSEIPHCVIST